MLASLSSPANQETKVRTLAEPGIRTSRDNMARLTYTYNPSVQRLKDTRLNTVQNQPELLSKTLLQKPPGKKKKNQNLKENSLFLFPCYLLQ